GFPWRVSPHLAVSWKQAGQGISSSRSDDMDVPFSLRFGSEQAPPDSRGLIPGFADRPRELGHIDDHVAFVPELGASSHVAVAVHLAHGKENREGGKNVQKVAQLARLE